MTSLRQFTNDFNGSVPFHPKQQTSTSTSTFTFALGFFYECYILFEKNLFVSDAAFAIALASANDALRPTHTKRTRKQKRKFSRMFVVYSLIVFACSLIFALSLPFSLGLNKTLEGKNGYSIHFFGIAITKTSVCV